MIFQKSAHNICVINPEVRKVCREKVCSVVCDEHKWSGDFCFYFYRDAILGGRTYSITILLED